MVEYRKTVELQADTDYWFVKMGELNRLNGAHSYPFTSEKSARIFAEMHKTLALQLHGVDREVTILFPDGREEHL